MIIRDKKGTERIAMPYDFQDVTITFTPSEWPTAWMSVSSIAGILPWSR